MPAALLDRAPSPYDPDAMYEAFVDWAADRGLTLYPAQDEAAMEVFFGSHLILSTPTGTGKSLVAVAAHASAVARGGRSYYTAPIKALVSEKFFALVEIFGAENVGMVTGDSSVNPDAPIICCTAEILANLALREGADAVVDQVVMDEFHYYADPDRGWAWQVPLLELPRAQFVLMSATLGDVTQISEDLQRRTGREVARVTGVERPVPLSYSYVDTPVQETVQELLDTQQAPIYVVHFSQASALELAQSLSSLRIASRERRDEIAEAIGEFRFTTTFGKTLSRLVRAGIGVHHAGMLPRYRRLVETLAQRGLLPVICGTDTLGVGINVPIRSVLMTGLSKFDGTRMRQLSAREFHQIAGRAGRAGYDTAGTVVVEAPEHEIENAASLRKAGDDPKKLKKVVRKKPAAGFVTWGRASFDRLIDAEPEPLTPQLEITAAMMINVIGRGGDALAHMRRLIFENHQTRARQYELARRALGIYRTLVAAGVVEVAADGSVRLVVELQPNFALNQPLSPFALAAIELLDPASTRSPHAPVTADPDADAVDDSGASEAVGSVTETGTGSYALDVVSVIEATLDDPRGILSQQQFAARGEAVAAMKRDGIEYEERMERLEDVTYPKPLDALLSQQFEIFAQGQPWVRDFELSPKSVVRDMYERAMSFAEYTQHYSLARSEGLVLRYLSDAYRAIRQTVPDEAKDEDLLDIIEWLGELVRQVDSSLVDEWSELMNPTSAPDAPIVPPAPPSVLTNRRAFTVLVRNELFRRIRLAALEREDELAALDPDVDWSAFLDAYFGEHDDIMTDAAARSAALFEVDEKPLDAPGTWKVEQIVADPEEDHDWRLRATVDLAASQAAGEAIVHLDWIGRL